MKNQKENIIHLLVRLWRHLPKRRYRQFAFLLILIVFSSFTEVLSIGAIVPFLTILTSPDKIFQSNYAKPFIEFFNYTNSSQLILPLVIIFILFALLAGASRLLLLWVSTKLSFATGADISIDIYRKTLFQPYKIHIARNSSDVVSGITGKAGKLVFAVILPTVTMLSSSVIIVSILSAVIAVDPNISLLAFLGFGVLYGIIAFLAKNRLSKNSKIISKEYVQVHKALQEGLGGIREVLLDGSQNVFCKIYQASEQNLRKAYADTTFTGVSPRFAMESLGMVLIAVFAYFTFTGEGFTSAIPILGTLAVGAQRILPVLQQAYNAWTSIRSNQALLVDVLAFLDQPLPAYANLPHPEPMQFQKYIKISDLSFRYNSDLPDVLNSINLEIPKGARVGFIGSTGSGKSTLIDILMGLLEPTSGVIQVDETKLDQTSMRSWQTNIAHVPQNIFLADISISENIAFGIPKEKIDKSRVAYAAKQAQIDGFIQTLEDGYDTSVGERGVRLSGGQRQRIGIARALYKKASVIVFDEATSALDNETEEAVMNAISNLGSDLTIIMIAHRLSTIQNCDMIIELKDGNIFRKGKYNELFNDSNESVLV